MEQLAVYQILFKFNLPNAPHFGGVCEQEVCSIKAALQVAVGSQSVSKDVLSTVLVEGILNLKPLGCVSADVADLYAITPNFHLIASEEMGWCRWRSCGPILDSIYKELLLPRSRHTRNGTNHRTF